MDKDFLRWNRKKETLHHKVSSVFFHEREVWFCHVGINIGFEQDGKGENFGRPVLIFKKFNNDIFWGIPLTTKKKSGKYYSKIILGDSVERLAILSQLRLIDRRRLYQKIGVVREDNYKSIEDSVIKLCKSY